MRKILLGLIVLEATALAAFGGYLAFGDIERHRRHGPSAPIFRPPFYEAGIGDKVRYRIEDRAGNVTGFFDYEVVSAVVFKGTAVGRDFTLRMTRVDKSGRGGRDMRLLRVQPRAAGHGWLPPRFHESNDYPAGARPIVKSIRSLSEDGRPTGEFLVEAVIPRDSLEAVAERYWVSPDVAVFGVRRWERGDEVWIRHTDEFAGRQR